MAFLSLKQFLARMGLATPEQFDEWNKAWKVAVTSGSQETLLALFAGNAAWRRMSSCSSWPRRSTGRIWICPS